MNAVELCRVDPSRNMRRFYRLDVQPDLFGGVLLLKQLGISDARALKLHIDSVRENPDIHITLPRGRELCARIDNGKEGPFVIDNPNAENGGAEHVETFPVTLASLVGIGFHGPRGWIIRSRSNRYRERSRYMERRRRESRNNSNNVLVDSLRGGRSLARSSCQIRIFAANI